MSRPRIAVRCPLNDRARAALAGFAEVVEDVAAAEGVLIDSAFAVDDAVLAAAPAVRAVASISVGYDKVDVGALDRRGVAFSNTRGALDEAVADLTFWLVAGALRRFVHAIRWTSGGGWANGAYPLSTDVAGKTIGILGFGRIGRAVATRAQLAGMHVIYHNRTPRADDAATGASYRDRAALLAESDVVVLLVPLSAETTKLFDATLFARMKPGAYLVNVARGAIVDQDALLAALASGRLRGAALDVTDPEPIPGDHPLLQHPEIVVTPHVGSATVETRERMSLLAIENLRCFFAGEPMPTRVVSETGATA